MFEIFTERARRVIFFGRYEASKTGAKAIDTEHLLLALIRENVSLLDKIPNVKTREFRDELLTVPYAPPTPTEVDLPLSLSAKRVLQHADDERKALGDPSITTGHLLLGILQESDSPSARILRKYGTTRESVVEKMKLEPETRATNIDLTMHQTAHTSVTQDDDATVVQSTHTHNGHVFRTIARYRTSSDRKKVHVALQITGPGGAQQLETEFDIPPGTMGQ